LTLRGLQGVAAPAVSRSPARGASVSSSTEDTDVKELLIEAINLLFTARGNPQIASDPIRK